MKNSDIRHYSEEELLMLLLDEEPPEAGLQAASHIKGCRECREVQIELQDLLARVRAWKEPEVADEEFEIRKTQVLKAIRKSEDHRSSAGIVRIAIRLTQRIWDYALSNPLPTLGYIVAALAFASERTITVLRLDEILPASGEVIEILRQVF